MRKDTEDLARELEEIIRLADQKVQEIIARNQQLEKQEGRTQANGHG